ncbi:MAG: response regulator [Erysipelotrichaceae bacterium]|nr:response regulator [Erysipelotrichaceae bacterium]
MSENNSELNYPKVKSTAIFKAMTDIYYAIVLLDLQENTFEVLKGNVAMDALLGKKGMATDALNGMVQKLVIDEDRNNLSAFNEYESLADRLADKDIISCDFTGVASGPSRASIYPVERNEEGKVTKVIYCAGTVNEDTGKKNSIEHDVQIQQGVIRALANEYELLVLIDVSTRRFILYRAANNELHRKAISLFGENQDKYIDEVMSTYIDQVVYPDDRERVRFTSKVDEVLRRVPEIGIYVVPYRGMPNGDKDRGNFRYYQANFARFKDDNDKEYLVLGFRDVNDTMLEEIEIREGQTVLDTVRSQYITMYYADMITDEMKTYKTVGDFEEKYGNTSSYSESMGGYVRYDVSPVDRERCLELIDPQYVINRLQNEDSFSFTFEDTSLDRKFYGELTYIKANEAGTKVVICGKDITEDTLKEKEIEEELDARYNMIQALSDIYFCSYYAELDSYMYREIKGFDKVQEYTGPEDYFSCAKMRTALEHCIHPDYIDDVLKFIDFDTMRQRLEGKTSITIEYIGLNKGWVRAAVYPANYDDNGRLTHIFLTFIQIDDEKKEELRQQELLVGALSQTEKASLEYERAAETMNSAFYLIHETMKSGMWGMSFNEKGEMVGVYWSDEFRKMLGFKDKNDFPDELESWSDRLHPEDKESVLKEFYDTINDYTGNKTYDVKYRLMNNYGRYHWYHAAGRLSRRSDGTPRYYVGLFVDITDDVNKNKLLEDALAAAEAANHVKSDFLANMSHDIRTPMNGIIGMTAIAATHIDDKERVMESLHKITGASRHLLSLINEVLDMSKIESGKIDLNEEEFNLSELVDNMVTMIQPQVEAHKHDFRISIQNVTHEKVIGDSLRMQQVFMNLMSNAVKYTPDGGIIKLTIEEKPSNKTNLGCFVFTFEDNGIGMSQEYLEHIFEPFTRAEDGRISGIQGTGLGMPIARNIVRMTGGDIEVKSKLDEGSTFTVTLYLKLQDDTPIDYSEFKDLNVLVADDDKIACESACIMLNDIGMKAEGVLSGKEAVDKVVVHHNNLNDFFACILDWKMPDMDGVHTAKAIRQAVGPDVPIIIISAYDWSEIEQEARAAGVDAFISKPLFKSRLVRVFDNLINKEEEKEEASPLEDIENMDFSGHKILLVEDNELNREIAVEILEMANLEVECANDGVEAVNMMTACPDDYYDLIFMDIRMPRMNGYEATRAIRSMDRAYAKRIPIIAMSANAFAQDVEESRNSGMNEHIAKPLDMGILAKTLNKWIRK